MTHRATTTPHLIRAELRCCARSRSFLGRQPKRVAMGRHGSLMVYRKAVLSALLIAAFPTLPGEFALAQNRLAIKWQSPAQFRRLLKNAIKGTLLLDNEGIEFRAPKFSQRWLYGEIKTFDLSGARELVITGYENRHWHEPGERSFRFTLSRSMPPGTAAEFAARVGRPVINGDPYPA